MHWGFVTDRSGDADRRLVGALQGIRAIAAIVVRRTKYQRTQCKRRWLLAEKLAETEEAELYQRLHEQVPDDREVLARIAGVRGQVEMGIKYLTELSDTASDPEEAGAINYGSEKCMRPRTT